MQEHKQHKLCKDHTFEVFSKKTAKALNLNKNPAYFQLRTSKFKVGLHKVHRKCSNQPLQEEQGVNGSIYSVGVQLNMLALLSTCTNKCVTQIGLNACCSNKYLEVRQTW